jgi:hypothetical protein
MFIIIGRLGGNENIDEFGNYNIIFINVMSVMGFYKWVLKSFINLNALST